MKKLLTIFSTIKNDMNFFFMNNENMLIELRKIKAPIQYLSNSHPPSLKVQKKIRLLDEDTFNGIEV